MTLCRVESGSVAGSRLRKVRRVAMMKRRMPYGDRQWHGSLELCMVTNIWRPEIVYGDLQLRVSPELCVAGEIPLKSRKSGGINSASYYS